MPTFLFVLCILTTVIGAWCFALVAVSDRGDNNRDACLGFVGLALLVSAIFLGLMSNKLLTAERAAATQTESAK